MPMQTEKHRGQSERFEAHLTDLTRKLGRYDLQVNMAELYLLKDQFHQRVEDFFQQEHKLNLAVLGQLKAGKSSFLNALLFEGAAVLPEALTPKTAVLTQIEYATQDALVVEYYQKEEWQTLERVARSPVMTDMVRMAQELVGAAIDQGTDVARYIALGTQTIPLHTQAEIATVLNRYVGENGEMTPVVKSVTLQLNNAMLQGVVVVDTPGLNDPVLSRTEQTRRYLETCDIAFFLSRSGHFLDNTDVELLTKQLPQKGLKKLMLVASLYDEALTDCVCDYMSLEEADEESKIKLRRHAMKRLSTTIAALQKSGYPQEVLQVVEQCKQPIFVSALAQKMSGKAMDAYTGKEQLILSLLSFYHPVTEQRLQEIGGIAQVQALFAELVARKERILAEKADVFVLSAQIDLREILLRLRQNVAQSTEEVKKALAQSEQKSRLRTQQMLEVQNRVQDVFQQEGELLRQEAVQAIFALRQIAKNDVGLVVRTAVKTKNIPRIVQDSVVYKPWTWNKSHVEYTVRNYTSTYLMAEDAVQGAAGLVQLAQVLWDKIVQKESLYEQLRVRLDSVVLDFEHQMGQSPTSELVAARVEECLQVPVLPPLVLDEMPSVGSLKQRYAHHVYRAQAQESLKQEARAYIAQTTSYLTLSMDKVAQRTVQNYNRSCTVFSERLFAQCKTQLIAEENERQKLQGKLRLYCEIDELLAQNMRK